MACSAHLAIVYYRQHSAVRIMAGDGLSRAMTGCNGSAYYATHALGALASTHWESPDQTDLDRSDEMTAPKYILDMGTGEMVANLQELSDTGLLRQYERALAESRRYRDIAGHDEQEIHRRIEQAGGTMIPSDEFICEFQSRATYDQVGFTPLKEVFSSVELDKVCSPGHEETIQVPEKWDTRKVISLAKKYGVAALGIVERAKRPGNATLKFERIPTPGQEAQ
jgi:hypothetical protein